MTFAMFDHGHFEVRIFAPHGCLKFVKEMFTITDGNQSSDDSDSDHNSTEDEGVENISSDNMLQTTVKIQTKKKKIATMDPPQTIHTS